MRTPRSILPHPMNSPWPWITDALRELPDATERRMFGCHAFYKEGKMVMVLTGEGDEPWNGVCLCTDRAHHPSLLVDFPALVPHPVLGKWLYVSCEHPDFENTVEKLLRLVATNDPRPGVEPKPKRRKTKSGPLPVKKQKSR